MRNRRFLNTTHTHTQHTYAQQLTSCCALIVSVTSSWESSTLDSVREVVATV